MDSTTLEIIYHPKLAKELIFSKQFHFFTPEEDSYWRNWREPRSEDEKIKYKKYYKNW